MSTISYGHITGHCLGRLMRDSVRRVIKLAEGKRRFALEFQNKQTAGKDVDYFSDLDVQAQHVYHQMVRECLPGAGFVAEEGKIQEEPTERDGIVITADGIDGTKALRRQQSHGIGTMVSAVQSNRVIAAYVGDICTGEIYGYHPESTRVSRIVESMHGLELRIDPSLSLRNQYVLLRDHPEGFSDRVQRLISKKSEAFAGLTVMGGSIGTWFAMLWKGEVGCAILPPHTSTPWDWCPNLGINERLGFVMLYPDGSEVPDSVRGNLLQEGQFPSEMIVVHECQKAQLRWNLQHLYD